MKIAFLLVTRGNPKRAAGVIECARSLASGKHKIVYVVGIDADDLESREFFQKNYPTTILSIDSRPNGVGAVWNRCVKRAGDCDIYCPFPDDSWIASPNWDEIIALSMTEAFPDGRLGVFAWDDMANPNQCTLPIVTREWLELTGSLYDERFPFWFYDTCVDELYSFITGRRVSILPMLKLAARKGLTQRMRDLPFWWDFYVSTRRERLFKAAEIRKKLGIDLAPSALAACIKMWGERDKAGRSGCQEIEAALAEKRKEPTPEYLKAKLDAERLMAA